MELRSLILEVAAGWKQFHSLGKDDRNHPVHKLVVEDFPLALHQVTADPAEFKFEGSVGRGILTAAPWIACFHTSVTTSAQNEYYVVYLFSVDMQNLVLELGFGVTQFEKRFGRGQLMRTRLRTASLAMQRIANNHRISCFSSELNDRVSFNAANLGASGYSNLHQGYEQGAIFHVTYTVADLPSEEVLVGDLNHFLALYRQLAEDPSVPDVGDIAWADAKAPTQPELFPATEFVPRSKLRRVRGLDAGSTGQNRHSKRAEKIGREAERHVVSYERKKLVQLDRADLADRIIWHRDYPVNRTPGWDITSYDMHGHKIFIEVKGTVDRSISEVNLTRNEWTKAQSEQNRERYYIYLVTEALTNPKIEILRNPAQWVDDGLLEVTASDFQLNLRSQTPG